MQNGGGGAGGGCTYYHRLRVTLFDCNKTIRKSPTIQKEEKGKGQFTERKYK